MLRNEVTLIIDNLLKDNKKRKIHISLNNRRFYNGFILNRDDEDTISFIDDKLGYIPVLYSQIVNIEPMIER